MDNEYPQQPGDQGQPPQKRQRSQVDPDDDDDGEKERRKIEIKFIADKGRRHITFSKRKAGIMKKAYELSVLTGTQVLLLVVSETGLVYTFTTPKLQPLVTKSEGKNLIQQCLNAPEDGSGEGDDGDDQQSEDDDRSTMPQQQQQQQQQPQGPYDPRGPMPPYRPPGPPRGMPMGVPMHQAPGPYGHAPNGQPFHPMMGNEQYADPTSYMPQH